jgi:hypothetical protein
VKCGDLTDDRHLEIERGIFHDDFHFLCKAENRSHAFQLLLSGERAVFPRCAELRQPHKIQLLHEANALGLGERLELTENDPVAIERGFAKLAPFCVFQVRGFQFFDGHRFTITAGRHLAGGFPLANRILRFFPVVRIERLPDLLAADESINPYRTAAAAILATFAAVLASFQMPPVSCEHGARVYTLESLL